MGSTIVTQARERARAIFAHHVGVGPAVEGYGATAWRQWLICGVCNCGWFVVRKDDPLARPRHFPCSLADCKAWLREGR